MARSKDHGRGGQHFPANPPNDKDLRDSTRKRNHCQRCDASVKLSSQKTVRRNDNGTPEIARASKTGSHYCSDCSKVRLSEVKRQDERAKEANGSKPKPTAKRAVKKATAKKTAGKAKAAKKPAKKVTKPRAKRTPKAATQEPSF